MNDWITNFYFFFLGGAVLLSVLGLWFTAIMPGIDCWSRRFFLCYFIVLMMCCFSALIEMLLQYYPALGVAIYPVLFLESLLL